jgi:hypothetical protein
MANVTGIIGIDGLVPIYDPNRRFNIWSMSEIYLGRVAKDKFVPKLNDLVLDIALTTFQVYRVSHVNELTLVPTLTLIRNQEDSSSFTQTEMLLGIGSVTGSDTYRVYLDASVNPPVMAVDSRLRIPGSMSKVAKIFKGPNTDDSPVVISRTYDTSGRLLSDNVTLELISTDSHIGHVYKYVPVFNVSETLLDGEIVTFVAYDDLGVVVFKRQLLVVNTGFTPKPDSYVKYITGISLQSAFLSQTNDSVVEYPLNATISSMSLFGVVTYSDGTTMRLPVDGTRFKLYGLDQYIATIVGHKHDLVLAYTLADGEKSYGTVSSNSRIITKAYSIVTVMPNLAYSVKIFGYPFYIDVANGYKMHFYMLNLDRNIFMDVTDKVMFDESTGTFDPKAFGVLQRKSISVNLNDVSKSFKYFRQVQVMDIVLIRPPELNLTSFTVAHESGGSTVTSSINTSVTPTAGDSSMVISRATGNGIQAIVVRPSDQTATFNCGEVILENWLNRVYYSTYPLIDRFVESKPPMPSHFTLTYGGVETMYTIHQWNDRITFGASLKYRDSILIKFIKRTSTNDLYLSCNLFPIVG